MSIWKPNKGEKGDPGEGASLWLSLVNTWTSEPTSESYSGGDGEVYAYTYGTTIYYRFIPTVYDSAQDSFYSTFVNPILSGLLATRGEAI